MSSRLPSNRYHPYQPILSTIQETKIPTRKNTGYPKGSRIGYSDLSKYFSDVNDTVTHVINGKCKFCHHWHNLYTKTSLEMRCQKCWDNYGK